MPRFTKSTQKYDCCGRRVPKGRNGIKMHKLEFPDCQIFDSRSEYLIFLELQEQQNQGLISNLRYQVKFELVKSGRWWHNVKQKWAVIRSLNYICDFVFERDNKTICLDCKGWKQKKDKKSGKIKWHCYYDETYKIKKKLFLSQYPDFVFEER